MGLLEGTTQPSMLCLCQWHWRWMGVHDLHVFNGSNAMHTSLNRVYLPLIKEPHDEPQVQVRLQG